MNELPKEGDRVTRARDGAAFTITGVVEAGGEEMVHLRSVSGGETLELTGASFVRHHDQDVADFEIA